MNFYTQFFLNSEHLKGIYSMMYFIFRKGLWEGEGVAN